MLKGMKGRDGAKARDPQRAERRGRGTQTQWVRFRASGQEGTSCLRGWEAHGAQTGTLEAFAGEFGFIKKKTLGHKGQNNRKRRGVVGTKTDPAKRDIKKPLGHLWRGNRKCVGNNNNSKRTAGGKRNIQIRELGQTLGARREKSTGIEQKTQRWTVRKNNGRSTCNLEGGESLRKRLKGVCGLWKELKRGLNWPHWKQG